MFCAACGGASVHNYNTYDIFSGTNGTSPPVQRGVIWVGLSLVASCESLPTLRCIRVHICAYNKKSLAVQRYCFCCVMLTVRC